MLTAMLLYAGSLQVLDQRGQQIGGQIVHAIVTAVLQYLERDALAGAGQAADQKELHLGFIAPSNSWSCR